jgi:hypothetical protein
VAIKGPFGLRLRRDTIGQQGRLRQSATHEPQARRAKASQLGRRRTDRSWMRFSMRRGRVCRTTGAMYIGSGDSPIFNLASNLASSSKRQNHEKTRNALRDAGLTGDADRARTDDLLRDRRFQ